MSALSVAAALAALAQGGATGAISGTIETVSGPNSGEITNTVRTPRLIKFALRYSF